MRILRIIGIVAAVIAALVIVVFIMGALVPEQHTVTATVDIPAPQSVVWARIEDVNQQPTWRTGLKAVQPLPPRDGHTCWLEIQSMGKMPLCESLAAAPSTRIVYIADPKLPFGGEWTYQLEPEGANITRLTITENGTVGPWFFRFVDHYFIHEDSQIKQYEADLLKSVGK